MGAQGILLLCMLVADFSGVGWASPPGTQFITTFMQNGPNGLSGHRCSLRIRGLHDNTTVNITVVGGSYSTAFPIQDKNTLTLTLPSSTETRGSGVFKRTVYINATQPIVAHMFHEKFRSSESTALLPFSRLGKLYYVYTPKTGPSGSSKELSVVAKEETNVEIRNKGFVQLNGKSYPPNSVINVLLAAMESLQLLSSEDLSGSRVTADKDVALLSGHTCAQKKTKCNHVFEQLLPVDNWGTTYLVPPVSSSAQQKSDVVAVVSAGPTQVTFTTGDKQEKRSVVEGQVLELELSDQPMKIEANDGIQVIYLSWGGKGTRYEYGPFMMNIMDVHSYCSAYAVFGQRSIDNQYSIIAENSAIEGITVDGQSLQEPQWKKIAGTDFSWMEITYGSSATSHRIEHATQKFGVQSFGTGSAFSYGNVGSCLKDPGPPPPTCRKTVCPSRQVCVIESGKPKCVRPQVDLCWAAGDPHLRSLDNVYFDFMGTCTYTFAKVCGDVDGDLPKFSVQIKNDNRGNVRVSYVAQVTLQTGGHTIVIRKAENGFVRVDNSRRQLPISLLGGTLRIFQSGNSAVIHLGNDMTMSYDWNHYLWLELTRRYAGKMCGMCGNYNQNPADDFLTPTGTQAADAIAFGASWAVEDGTVCWHDCRGPCLSCPPTTAQQYMTDNFCGLIAKADGPFGDCHSILDQKMYMENCVFDVCVNSGYKQISCQAVGAYAEACQRAGVKIGPWRDAAGCPLLCPAESTYKLCGNACPQTCDDPEEASVCPEFCMETCECNAGFVLSQGKCVPRTSCGCKYNGFTYSPNEEFWNDTVCQQRCVCNPETRKVECKTSPCRAEEECVVKNGILNCYPRSHGVCLASGDPHYFLFDGIRLDFQGTCVYLLVGLSDQSRGLTDFQVRVRNQNRGNVRVSFTSVVYIIAYGLEFELNRQYPNKVIVNNTLRNLPYKSPDGLYSFYRSPSGVVGRFSFGLVVGFDYNSNIRVEIPGTYANALFGLCGNFNKNPKDDLIPRGGNAVADPATFGKSWKVAGMLGCRDDGSPVCESLPSEEKRQRDGGLECGVLVSQRGPFSGCHALLDAEPFFSSCVYDSCVLEKRQNVFCPVITSYMVACQAAGATVQPWRRPDFCPLSCPAHSSYEACADPCPVTCNGLGAPEGCSGNCTEGCVCNDGYILSGGDCVPISQCGCHYKGSYHSLGESLYDGTTCSQKCTCTLGGVMTCAPSSCRANEECRVEKAVLGCHPLGSATCSVAGHSNYRSFDGLSYKFQGQCSFVLAKSCSQSMSGGDQKTEEFSVIINQEKEGSNSGLIEKLTVVTNRFDLALVRQQRGVVQINGVTTRLPVTLLNGQIRVECYGQGTLIKTDYGLQVRFDHKSYAAVTVPGTYRNAACGICGNYNGDPEDDGPGSFDVVEYGNKWKAPGETGEKCGDCGSKAQPCSPCPAEKRGVFSGNVYCGVISDPSGPFAKCHSAVDHASYVEECISDLCQTNGEDSDVLCYSAYAYADACRFAGVKDITWRTESFCPLNCGPHSHYSVSADMCSTTCASVSDTFECSDLYDEGCECDEGYFFDGSDCLPLNQCGCYDNGVYYKAYEVVLNDDCSQQCTCNPTSGVSCVNKTCSENEKCLILHGVRSCVNTDPCKSKNCRVKETCKVQDGVAVCTPDFKAKCTAWGDPHLTTADGLNYDAQGTCTYVFAQYAGNDTGLVPFKLTTKNDNRGSQAVSFVRKVELSMYGLKIAVEVGEFPEIRVDGELTSLPVTLADGKLKAYRSGFTAILEAANDIVVTFDWNAFCSITIPSSYYSLLTGLCGNLDMDPSNDHRAPDGTLITSITNLLAAWKEEDEDIFCFHSCPGQCPTCSAEKQSQYRGDNQCGLMVKEDGPFRECLGKIDPKKFFNSCLFDVCANDGANSILCQALEMYATTCMNEGIKMYDWRTPSNCPKMCDDPNSRYTACGNACPASCSDRTAPSSCKKPCVETCECNEGLLLSGGQCVPVSSCGCQYNGRYYEPNQSWYDERCTTLCTCNSEMGMAVCQPTSCKDSETCMVANGKRGCHPTQHRTCIASGDPHYRTCDNRRFSFMKTCIYQLIKVTSDDPSLVKFSITVQNNHQGNRAVSYTHVVTLEVYNKTLTISRDAPGKIKVDGQDTYLPYSFESPKISAFLAGFDVVITTDFGLKIAYDRWMYLRVDLPITYTGAVNGLCGNCNGDPTDDFVIGDGVQAKTDDEFGDHWKVGEVKGCTAECTDCPKCTDAEKEPYKSDWHCGLLSKADGPFGQCHASVDHTPFFEDCLYDACAYKGHQSIVCNILSSYVSECQKNGSMVKEWRTPSFCELTCPPNSHYELLGDGCPATCFGMTPPKSCRPSRTEGCYCDNGYIRSGGDCVPVAECGCVFENTYYKTGQEFYADNLCQRKCTCHANGMTTCQDSPCGANAECKVAEGVLGCHPKEFGQCTTWGNFHYTSLDGVHYSYQGTCSSIFIRIQSINFQVLVNKEPNVSGIKSVLVTHGGNQIYVERGTGRSAHVNGERYTLPFHSSGGDISIIVQGSNIIIKVKEGLRVIFDRQSYLSVGVPSTYSGLTEGLCGHFNENPADDFRLPSGEVVDDVAVFGKSWSSGKSGLVCEVCSGERCPTCDQAGSDLASSPAKCGMISDAQGPFKGCHKLVKPEQYVKDCVVDVCGGGGGQEGLCASLQAYTVMCQEKGATVESWRSIADCPLTCPANSHHSSCTHTCKSSCYDLLASSSCTETCFEGCECDSGFLFDGDQCVPFDKCGCIHNNRYLKATETILNEDCSQECSCVETSGSRCQKKSCAEDEICQIHDGSRSCENRDPCKSKTCREKESCKVQGNEAVCVPDYVQQCTAWGDPHYSSCDGMAFDAQGTCTYVFVQYDGTDSGLEPFKVTTKNNNRGSKAVSYVAKVSLLMYGVTVTAQIGEFRKIRVNGELSNLPAILADGRLKASQSGFTVRVEAENGVIVTYDWNWSVTVTLPSSYHNMTSGLCGNCDKDPGNDRRGRDGAPVSSTTDFIRGWREDDQDASCFDVCPGQCLSCDQDEVDQYRGDGHCGILLKEDGPFRDCVAEVEPKKFFDACLFDVCMNGGAKVILCQALETYVKMCLSEGVKVYDWRTASDCPIICNSENSHYNACGNACPATCFDRNAPTACRRACEETCECDEGTVLSGDKCVPASSCGCNLNGRYYEPNQSWLDEQCTTVCRCEPGTGNVACQPNTCKASEACTVEDGIRGCRPRGFSTCTTHGDPHEETFDGKRYSFMGACIYQLVNVTDPTLPHFSITVENEKRGSGAVSFTKSVTLELKNHLMTMSRDHPHQVQVDGILKELPYFHEPTGVQGSYPGSLMELQTSFGLVLSYGDWNYVRVKLPNTYKNAVSGLCGDNNGDPSDDFVKRDGVTAKDAKEFGDHWKVGEFAGCKDECPDCVLCNDQQREVYKGDQYCGLLIKSDGPFGQCHASVDSKPFFDDCVFDACEYKGHQSLICDIMSSYVHECQRKGSVINDWRTPFFCEKTCPPNSHYELLGDGCPATCVGMIPPKSCRPSHTEGCYCNDGFLRSGGDCVPVAECGCVFENTYYKTGQEFYADNLCQRKCTCHANGITTCQDSPCGANAECKVAEGVLGCHPKEFGQCTAWGDPHYIPLDGLYYTFQGTCSYIFIRIKVIAFEVIVTNEAYNYVAVTKSVTVKYGRYVIQLERGKPCALINGERYNLPIHSPGGEFWIAQQANNIVIQTKEQITVLFDRQYFVTVWVPSTFSGSTEGLCRDFGKTPKGEFRLPNGTTVNDVAVFGESWAVEGEGRDCKGCSGDQCPKCDEAGSALARSSTKCGMIGDPEGPFRDCHRLVPPAKYVDSCVYDVCNGRGGQEALCANLQAYTAMCQAKEGNIEPWRNLASCPLTCPPNSHYNPCFRSCQFTCHGILAPKSCSKTCFEGCKCESGYVFDGEDCVPLDKCGCIHNGRYLKFNESVLNDDCTRECTCDPSRRVVCANRTCGHDEKCQLLDGVRSCVSTNPCHFKACREKEKCQVQDGQAVCIPEFTALCYAWGDPHLEGFDNGKADFQGTCTYIFSRYTGPSTVDAFDPLEPYEITIQNNNRGDQTSSFVRSMNLKMYGTNILVQFGDFPRIQVDGVSTNLPVVLHGGLLNVTRSGFNAEVTAANGLHASYDWNWHVRLNITSSYFKLVSGLCGDFNGDPTDDQKAPNGTIISSVIDWASAWKVYNRDPFCYDYCPGECPVCEEDKKALYGGDNACGILFKEGGPFRECSKEVDPKKFFDNCLVDVCMKDGAQAILCQALEAYSTTCLGQGLRIYDWRTPSGCPKVCEDQNSHYNDCTTACPASCADRKAPATCDRPCVEACECQEGMLLSGDKCVPITKCGCQYNGQYYEPYQTWYDEECTALCKCDPILGTVDCQSTSCKETESCELANGIRGCYPTGYTTCSSTGDPHYLTFDGTRYSFTGSCVYQLVKVTSNDTSLTPFTINIHNAQRGSKDVSFNKEVTTKIYNRTITMSQDHPQQAKVDGRLVNLPYKLGSTKASLFISDGSTITLQTEFGLTVSYYNVKSVNVRMPSTYRNALDGLCGNNNGDPADDLTFGNGIDEFVGRWRVGKMQGCANSCSDCAKCNEGDRELYKGEDYCGLIKKADGPFRQSHLAVDPAPYFDNCVSEVCAHKGLRSVVCAQISTYVSDCQRNGSIIESWRKPSFCEMSCPPNSHYDLQGDGCPATCYGLVPPQDCKRTPTEGCYCDNGFILSGKDCVPISECGCAFEDAYYVKGQEFYSDGLCGKRCTCEANGVVNCKEASCGPEEKCELVDGHLGCHPKELAQCTTWGDSHFFTFDGLDFDFQGTCSYVLTRLKKDQGDFEVVVHLKPFGKTVALKAVTVTFGKYVVYMGGEIGSVLLNGEKYTLPSRSQDHDVWMTKEGNNEVLNTIKGFEVRFDNKLSVSVKVPSSYSGRTEGLCGSYNNDPKDDFRLPDGSIVTDKAVFVESWIAARDGSTCQGCSGGLCSTCDEGRLADANSTTKCGMIVDPQGPFKECHHLVKPETYHQSCLLDVCPGPEDPEALCASLQAYTALCQEQGAKIEAWRSADKCPFSCQGHSHYELCTWTCGFTCHGLQAASTCSNKCFEGCQCHSGYMFDGEKCVEMNKCGCVYNGRYIKAGESVMSAECSQRCTCQSGIVSCVGSTCSANEVCQIRNGVRGCHPKESQCSLSPDHHFTTFDGVSGGFPLHGSYILTSSCNMSQPGQFMVVYDVHRCGGKDGRKSSLQVFTSHGLISVNDERTVWLNGWMLKDQTDLGNGEVKVSVTQSDVTLEVRSKITVTFKANGEILVTAKEGIAGEVCGPCGNFNRVAIDDLRLRTGEPSTSIAVTIYSWAAKHLSTCMV